MPTLGISPAGHFFLESGAEPPLSDPALSRALADAFALSIPRGLLALGASGLLTARLPPSLAFGRELTKLLLSTACATLGAPGDAPARLSLPPPLDELLALAESAPPMTGGEYLDADALASTWNELATELANDVAAFDGGAAAYLRATAPVWNVVGRVCLHLAENRAAPEAPFAFLATYVTGLSAAGRARHAPLGKAVEEYAGARQKTKLLALLEPLHRAAETSPWLKELVSSGDVFHPLAWSPAHAMDFLRDVPSLEASGLVVRVPENWGGRRPPRPRVKVTLGKQAPGGVGLDAMLDFETQLVLDGETLTAAEQRVILASTDGLVLLKGKWVEVDRAGLHDVLDHWKRAEKLAAKDGLTFREALRLIAGAETTSDDTAETLATRASWSIVSPGPWLDTMLAELRDPKSSAAADPGEELHATLRPYQREGVAWLLLLTRLGLGACLADDMGLGKTIQVISLLLLSKQSGQRATHLLVVPASLLGNWCAELDRFAPTLRRVVAHPSVMTSAELQNDTPEAAVGVDVVLTTYGTVARAGWLAERAWGLVILDEAQAIKNPSAQQTRAVKGLRASSRIALTGTPIENRLGDLWSLFDFLSPGLLGSAAQFRALTKRIESDPQKGFGPLRNLVRPYILRRLKSDKSVVPDLPDKTEVLAFCSLTKKQAALYRQSVDELARKLETLTGIQRRGVVLSFLLRLKQICNHPSQWLGDAVYDPEDSGKLARLGEICEPIAARQEKVLVFTQFREMTDPLARFLETVFGRPGVVLHGETPVKKRQELVREFQDERGPPFFVLSLKAGGTGLNLTAASHVVHFDRWWNPAVESQATDRAYRIGQHRNVLVHKLVCRGTIEERVDALIEGKRGLSDGLFAANGGEISLTELSRDELLRLVALDIRSALDDG